MGRNSLHTLSAALLLMVWIATPILSLVHSVVEQHSYCVEHDRVEDANDGHDATSLLTSQSSEDDEAFARAQRGEAEQHSEGHEECAFSDSFTRETLIHQIDTTSAPAHCVLNAEGNNLPTSYASSTALLRIAPKNSPPQAA